MTDHQQKQIEVIDHIEEQVNSNTLQFSLVAPVEDYENDTRICLTSVHFPNKTLVEQIQTQLIDKLKEVEPEYYYYAPDSFHMTIKNIRVINDPPQFTEEDVLKAKKVLLEIIPNYKKFNVYFYRLLLFPNNLALIGTTDPELDNIILNLDKRLKEVGLSDDKKYTNSKFFFSNMTLARFPKVSAKFKQKVEELSVNISFDPYEVDSVTLLTCNAVFKKRIIIESWKLK